MDTLKTRCAGEAAAKRTQYSMTRKKAFDAVMLGIENLSILT